MQTHQYKCMDPFRFARFTILVIFLVLSLSPVVFSQEKDPRIAIIPLPAEMSVNAGSFIIQKSTQIVYDSAVSDLSLTFFNQYLNLIAGFNLQTVASTADEGNIELRVDAKAVTRPEGYNLQVTGKGIVITGHDPAGTFYGLQTLQQLLQKDKNGQISVPLVNINDYPRFSYRGMHLDVSRHFFPVSSIKKWIDILALYKINTFHWHLTDDQGWRIEIKQFPKLQEISSNRSETIIGHKRSDPHRFDGKPYGGYYTQSEIKEIVKYATDRKITVIPEIEMPGHAQATLAAYPGLGCTGGPYPTATYWGVFEDVYCAGKEETFGFLEKVLDEVLLLFPSAYIHIGGDECPKTRWQKCPYCQKRINDENLKDEHELQSYFIRRIEKYLAGNGRKIIGWDEILEGGIAPSATVMSWRGLEGGIAAAKMKHEVIMTPEKFVYLDYYQSLYENEQVAAGGYTPLSKLYGYEPMPAELDKNEAKYIKGVQANLWSEYIDNDQKAEYMMFPRMQALAEIAWSGKSQRDYPDFLKRLRLQEHILQNLNVNYFRHFDEVKGQTVIKANKPLLSLQTDLPDAEVRFTTNGDLPGQNSLLYTRPIVITSSQTIRASIYGPGADSTRVFTQKFNINKATGRSVNLSNPSAGNFTPEYTGVLVNGITGSPLYNDGEWTGFSGQDLVATVDLGKLVSVSVVGISVLKYHWQKMWEPDFLTFEVSSDGKRFTEVFTQQEFRNEGVNTVRARIKPVSVRYVRVKARNKGTIPEGSYGAGGKAMLLVDEIYIN